MVRMSKQGERRNQCPKRCRPPYKKTGSQKDSLELGYKEHANALQGQAAQQVFIPKVK